MKDIIKARPQEGAMEVTCRTRPALSGVAPGAHGGGKPRFGPRPKDGPPPPKPKRG